MVDIAIAQAGEGCPRCGSELLSTRGIEVGHVFKLGTFFSERLDATYIDRDGVERPIVMGCYGIGTGRLLAAAIEHVAVNLTRGQTPRRRPPSAGP